MKPREKDARARNLASEVFDFVARIPRGKVTTYGQIAAAVGRPRAPRIIGGILHRAPAEIDLPFHRVVNREGTLAPFHVFGGEKTQRRLLEDEGVIFLEDGRIDMSESLWKAESGELKRSRRTRRAPSR